MDRRRTPRPSPSPRATRPELPRTEPIRSWSTLFGSASGAKAGTPKGASNDAKGPGETAGTGGGAKGAVERGVELGYRVIDDYLRQGSAVANAFAGPARGHVPSMSDLPKLTERMMQYGSDFAAIWFDAMTLLMSNLGQGGRPGAAPDAGSAPAEPGPSPSADEGGAGRSRVSLELRSSRPTEVLFTLDAPERRGAVVVEELRDPSGARSLGRPSVELPEQASSPITVRVEVPAPARAGRYTGAVVDAATQNPRGRVTVIVGGPRRAP